MNKKYKEFVSLDLQEYLLYQSQTESEKKFGKEEKGEHGSMRKSKKQKMLKEDELLNIEKHWRRRKEIICCRKEITNICVA